jgi:hypothetical protein
MSIPERADLATHLATDLAKSAFIQGKDSLYSR